MPFGIMGCTVDELSRVIYEVVCYLNGSYAILSIYVLLSILSQKLCLTKNPHSGRRVCARKEVRTKRLCFRLLNVIVVEPRYRILVF
jgi:hypothetical protein